MLVWQGHRGKVRVVAFSRDGIQLASTAGHSQFVWLWDPTTGKLVRLLASNGYVARNPVFLPDGKHILGAYERGGLRVWELDSGKLIADLRFNNWGYNPNTIAVSPDGSRLIVTANHGLVEWANPATPTGGGQRRPDQSQYGGHLHPAQLSFSPLGTFLCLAQRRLQLMHPTTFQELASLVDPIVREPHGASASCFAFTPDETRLVIGFGRRAAIWRVGGTDPVTMGKAVQLRGHEHLVRAVGFLPGGERVLTAALDGTVRIWDSNTGAELRSLDWGIGKIATAAVSPAGTLCAAGGETGQLVVWDLDL